MGRNGTTWTEVLKLSDSTDVKADVKVTGDLIHALLYAGTNTQLVSAQYNTGTATYRALERCGPRRQPLPAQQRDRDDRYRLGPAGCGWRRGERRSPGQIVVYYSDPPYGDVEWPHHPGDRDHRQRRYRRGDRDCPGNRSACCGPTRTPACGASVSRRTSDGADPATWTDDEVPASQSAQNVGLGMADDHMNVAASLRRHAVRGGQDQLRHGRLPQDRAAGQAAYRNLGRPVRIGRGWHAAASCSSMRQTAS